MEEKYVAAHHNFPITKELKHLEKLTRWFPKNKWCFTIAPIKCRFILKRYKNVVNP